MQNEADNSFIYSPNITEFVTVSGQYCIFVENCTSYSTFDLLDKARKILALLYIKGSLLPKPGQVYEDENEKFVTEEDWSIIHDSIQKKLGNYDEYLDIINPESLKTAEITSASISENIADIYQDIKNFITLFNIGTEEIMSDAVGECQLNFEEFWGQKVVDSLKAIHTLLSKYDIPTNDEISGDDDPDSTDGPDTSNWIFTKRQSDYNNLN